jgi:D-serine deaminase-like pyridoxal phosphate-dependent protein
MYALRPEYPIVDVAEIPSPALVFHPALIAANIRKVIAAVGEPDRLRPHVKTHKTVEIVQMQLLAGVRKHKCATIAEAEMLAIAGAPDVLISYAMIGPNVTRLVKLIEKFPGTAFSTIVDHPIQLAQLSTALVAAHRTIDVLIDLNVGMNRTGIVPGPEADELYSRIANCPGIRPGGIHAYDGHNNSEALADRQMVARAALDVALAMRERHERAGRPVPRIVSGGTPGFPGYSSIRDVPGLECSPGTYVLHDLGYGSKYPDLGVVPAAVLLTRVVSRPTANRVTLDLGNKSVAADPPLAKRVYLLEFPDYTIVTHSEEHLVVETDGADRYTPGDVVYAIPSHVCPTVALHREALVAERNRVVGRWTIAARDRFLTI